MDRTGNERTGNRMLNIPVKGGAELTEATMAAINGDGYAAPAAASAGLKVAGCVQRYCDNRNGADGEQTVSVKRGVFVWDNDVGRHFKWSGDCTVAANKNLPIKAVTHTACGKKRHAFFLHRTGKAV